MPSPRQTPSQTVGPFFGVGLTRPSQSQHVLVSDRTDGERIRIEGHVLDGVGRPIEDALVEIWQANAHGRYTHPSDPNPAPLDPNFDGAAILKTDAEGRYRFKTIKPVAYPAGPNMMRPAHIHFQVTGREDRLVTQMYFAGDPYNVADPFLNSAGRKELLIMPLLEPTAEFEPDSKLVRFDIVVYKG
jgi:protocatechuate 3,4-dioxygenase beta subunit